MNDAGNPLLDIDDDIPFDRIRAEHVRPAVERLLDDARAEIARLSAGSGPRTYEGTLGALERATERLEVAMTVVGHLEAVSTTDALREAYNEMRPRVSELFSSIPLDAGLWRALNELTATEEARTLDPTRARFLKKTLDDFRRHGAELDSDGKRRLSAIDVELSKLTTRFAQNVLDATNAFELFVDDEEGLAGLPESAVALARQDAQSRGRTGYRFTLQAPSVMPLLTYLDDVDIRERVWRAFSARASSGEHDNRELIRKILELRREKARLLRFETFADLVLEDRMAGSGDKARSFVDGLRDRTRPWFERERTELLDFRREHEGREAEMMPWDVAYWSEKMRRARYDFDDEELRPYFPLESVLRGLFATVERLYGVTIEPRPEAPTWHDAVRAFEMLDGRRLGTFYVDPFPRDDKQGGAWMNGLVSSVPPNPQVGVFCANVSPPVGDRPALLRHTEVKTMFHEFGHLMHHMLNEVTVRSLGGAHVAWDFVELPSQIMENWCWEREALDLFAHHYETGAPIPDDLFEKMVRARTFRAASMQMRQLGFAAVDLALHVDFDPESDADPIALAREILAQHSATPLPDDYAMICSFSHLFAGPVAYASGYYSYKWAEVLDADAFTRFETEGVFDRRVGDAFREHVLSRGDSRDPMELYVAFMGREPSLEPLMARQGLTDESS
jgi:oligopeptidase A